VKLQAPTRAASASAVSGVTVHGPRALDRYEREGVVDEIAKELGVSADEVQYVSGQITWYIAPGWGEIHDEAELNVKVKVGDAYYQARGSIRGWPFGMQLTVTLSGP
jgi:hypothetical protein